MVWIFLPLISLPELKIIKIGKLGWRGKEHDFLIPHTFILPLCRSCIKRSSDIIYRQEMTVLHIMLS